MVITAKSEKPELAPLFQAYCAREELPDLFQTRRAIAYCVRTMLAHVRESFDAWHQVGR